VRTVTQSAFSYKKSRIVVDVHSYTEWPVLEFRLRVSWNEERRRLKFRIPTGFKTASILCEVPAAAVSQPADGEEHVHGRWLLIAGQAKGRPAALGVVSSGQHGFDFRGSEVRLSALRSCAYCHERGFDLGRARVGLSEEGTRAHGAGRPVAAPARKFSDIGVHEFRLLVTAGAPDEVKALLPGLADFLSAPPAVYPHLPYSGGESGDKDKEDISPPVIPSVTLVSLDPSNIRLLACRPSWDAGALILRLQEAVGKRTRAHLAITLPEEEKGHAQRVRVSVLFRAFEIKTVRVERDGAWRMVPMIEETSV
jgi:alpha-mannosidase